MAPAERGVSVPCILSLWASLAHALAQLCSSRGCTRDRRAAGGGAAVSLPGGRSTPSAMRVLRGKTKGCQKNACFSCLRAAAGPQREKDAAAAVAARGHGRTARRGDAPRALVHERQRLQGVHLRGGQGAR